MKRPLLFGVIFSLTLFGSLRAGAVEPYQQASRTQLTWQALAEDEQTMVDRLAADFFERALRLSQSRRIEAATAELYLAGSPEHRFHFRQERRRHWRAMPDHERAALRGVKWPHYSNLAETQKSPFRQRALETLGAASVNTQTASLEKEI